MRCLITITLLLFISCGYTQSNKFFGPESVSKNSESDSIKVKKVKKKLKFGVSVGLGSTILSSGYVMMNVMMNSYSGYDLFKKHSINSLPNFNLVFSKSLKKNSIVFTPGIRIITAKSKPFNSTISNWFFGENFSNYYLFKELKANQQFIDLPLIYKIKLNNIFSINLGLNVSLPIAANVFRKYNSIMIHTDDENLIQKTYFDVDEYGYPLNQGELLAGYTEWDYISFPNNFNIGDLSYGDRVTKMFLGGYFIGLGSITSGIEFSLNKKNRINFNYSTGPSRLSYTIFNIEIEEDFINQRMSYNRVYYESKSFRLQFLELNYTHIF